MTIEIRNEVLEVLQRRMTSVSTPDLLKLQKYPFFTVIDYGSFMTGASSNYLLGSSPRLGMATTAADEYCMMYSDKGTPPVVFHERRTHLRGFIRGEALLVSLPTLMKMDQVNYNAYKCQRRPVILELGEQLARGNRPFFARAWIYIGLDHAWKQEKMAMRNCFIEENKKIYEW